MEWLENAGLFFVQGNFKILLMKVLWRKLNALSSLILFYKTIMKSAINILSQKMDGLSMCLLGLIAISQVLNQWDAFSFVGSMKPSP